MMPGFIFALAFNVPAYSNFNKLFSLGKRAFRFGLFPELPIHGLNSVCGINNFTHRFRIFEIGR